MIRRAGNNNKKTGTRGRRWNILALAAISAWLAFPASAQTPAESQILERLNRLEQRQAELEAELDRRADRIRELEAALGRRGIRSVDDFAVVDESPAEAVAAATEADVPDHSYWGEFQPGGRGFKLAETPMGDVNFSAWTYVRYLNQRDLDRSYTDAFGRSREIDPRNDMQVNKVNLYFKGWVFDPKLRYLLYTWTANTSQGEGAQVVVAGNLSYKFNEYLDVGLGIGALPGTRSLRGTFPYWLKVDTRPIADEFFRPSYTTGIWAGGRLAEKVRYKLMLGNNLSQLGVSAAELDSNFNTVSGSLWWMPTTGEYGPAGGYGDFEMHDELATTLGVNVTRSREDRQSQPGTDDIQNTQLRLSDGTIIFTPNAFGTNGRINKATYLMSSFDAGMKYRGYSLEGEYYFRWLDDFAVTGDIPVDDLYDHGFQVQTSAMLKPELWQVYLAGSKIFGEYGNPWDFAVGLNWFPFRQRLMRWNNELQYLDRSPVGYSSVPFVVGADGWVFHSNLELYF